MFSDRNYYCVCHGCGKIHVIVAQFMSAPMMFRFPTNSEGVQWCLPMLGCPECMAADKGKPRSEHRIARAFDKGMTQESIDRVLKEFPEWLPRLEAEKKNRRY